MSAEAHPSWVLISVLFSQFPLEEPLALALHRVALELYRHGAGVGEVQQGLARGHVTNARREANIGTISGPVFEAELETERGHGQVRFILTRQGLELLGLSDAPPAKTPKTWLN